MGVLYSLIFPSGGLIYSEAGVIIAPCFMATVAGIGLFFYETTEEHFLYTEKKRPYKDLGLAIYAVSTICSIGISISEINKYNRKLEEKYNLKFSFKQDRDKFKIGICYNF